MPFWKALSKMDFRVEFSVKKYVFQHQPKVFFDPLRWPYSTYTVKCAKLCFLTCGDVPFVMVNYLCIKGA